ncbi:MAG: AmmeMemoRadiSam system protein B [bacterium]|nr:AmmeMemoRadiSam system protein B [bacterium]
MFRAKHLLSFLVIIVFILSLTNPLLSEDIRTPVFKGKYYHRSTPVLRRDVDYFLSNCQKRIIHGKILGFIIPHGKYKTSGQTAAYAYQLLRERKIDTVIIIGPSHNMIFPGISIYAKDYYSTPLGKVPVNTKLAEKLILENDFITYIPDAHLKEHSIEVQIPFLQRTLQDFQILPILIGNNEEDYYPLLTEALLKHIKDQNIILIASGNLSHYRSYFDATLVDRKTIKHIEEFNVEDLSSKFKNKECETCAKNSILTTMLTCQKLGADKIKLLKYTNSGEITGIQWKTVGYASFALFDIEELGKDTEDWLLKHGRKSLEEYIRFKKFQVITEKNPLLCHERGVYVTIKEGETTRGYLGYVLPIKPLYKAVSDSVIKAATEDLKYPPLNKKELSKVKIEISVLSNIEKINDFNLIEIGVHGIYLNKNWQSAIILPHVAKKNEWSKEELLKQVCQRAGLDPQAWKKDKEIDIYLFTAQTFSE